MGGAGDRPPQSVKFARRTSSGRVVSLSRDDDLDLPEEYAAQNDYINYTILIPPTPDNQPGGTSNSTNSAGDKPDGPIPYRAPSSRFRSESQRIRMGSHRGEKTEGGDRVGWIYGSVTEDVVTGYRMHNRGWRSVYCITKRDAFRGTAPINLTDHLHQPSLNIAFLCYLVIITVVLNLASLLEEKWSGIALEEWWRNERFWVIGGTGAHLAAVIPGLLRVIAVPLTIIIVNLVALVMGAARTVYSVIPQWSKLFGGAFFSFWVLAHMYPFCKGLMRRRWKMPTIIYVWAGLISITVSLLKITISPPQGSNSSVSGGELKT
ncbi:Cellulose synthase-like protein D3 [Abeliophyllum distichum]|uniref:Cellulose synthase-like protein D3 n=1 Tax=Abeliophyllum distichum TaxID=126358 RepID=A0ABD1Q022_9LAMI